ncbi:hypothetical protein A2T55_14090 [Brevibacterium linens]|uniref:Uncharacterized protein n=1 Tax=Brevibacterium linens TaxID=1703 RepID=A0A142NPP6_BRELN|nr:hypothetical protein [Brevibacterium linens]AMT94734.1 hypothetical protein A2T55_14090 [Brevibacterium linens]
MTSPIQLARTYARSYEASSRKGKGTILDSLTEATGWTRDHARHQLRSQSHQIRAGVSLDAVVDRRRIKPKKFSSSAQRALELVWKSSGRPCGKYLEAGMSDCLDSLERHGHLREGRHGYSSSVRKELLGISAATIDRYLRDAKTGDRDDSWLTGTGAGMRASFPRQRMRSLLEPEPGYFLVELLTIKTPTGEDCVTVTFTDVEIGWVQTKTFAPGTQVVDMLAQMVRGVPFVVTGILLPPAVPDSTITTWAEASLIEIHCTSDLRQGPRVPDRTFSGLDLPLGTPQATDAAIIRVNGLWSALADRLNHFMPVKNPVGWRLTPSGVRRREYDQPRTPVSRLLASGILCPEQTRELCEKSQGLDIAGLTARIAELKSTLS